MMGTGVALDLYNRLLRYASNMQALVRLFIIVVLFAIVVSLGSALYHLARGQGPGDSQKMVRALTVRITLSLILFFLLMAAWWVGLISPHGVQPR
jgi:spore maturation protein SpmB